MSSHINLPDPAGDASGDSRDDADAILGRFESLEINVYRKPSGGAEFNVQLYGEAGNPLGPVLGDGELVSDEDFSFLRRLVERFSQPARE